MSEAEVTLVCRMSIDNTGKQAKSRRILVIDDDRDSLEILLEPLRWEGYDARGVTSDVEAHKLVESWVPHVVILDWMAPSMAGLKVLRLVKERLAHVSCVFVSENSSTEAIIEALDSGADDYIVKPFVPLELLARIRTQLRIRDLHEQLLFANERLKELVDIDDLTGLYNMRSLYQRLDFEIERGRRFHRDTCVVMMDMDFFKTVNDGHDHLFRKLCAFRGGENHSCKIPGILIFRLDMAGTNSLLSLPKPITKGPCTSVNACVKTLKERHLETVKTP